MIKKIICIGLLFGWFSCFQVSAQAPKKLGGKEDAIENARPWVYWYWMHASVSEAGIRADLIAMKKQGLGGAYLMTIMGKPDSLLIQPPIVQLSPAWWQMLHFTMRLADSLHFKLAMHVGDGFATAGGPWITPANSMQKLVWTTLNVKGDQGQTTPLRLAQPETLVNYYRDVAVYAFPTPTGEGISTRTIRPVITTSAIGEHADVLIDPNNTHNFSYNKPCWITYAFDQAFTCRSIKIRIKGVSFQAKRLLLSVSDDGVHYKDIERLKPARSGWRDYVQGDNYSIPAVTAKYFRFSYDPAGTEPGAEDLDAAKWSPRLKICGLELFSGARIDHFGGKNGSIWRISDRTTAQQIPDNLCIARHNLINISSLVDSQGIVHWKVPKGNWTILRIGHTSTGQTNETGGGGIGLECDKFNPVAVTLQFNQWFGKIYKEMGDSLSSRVLKIFHVDSWESGSQNWSPIFVQEFKKRRGYDPLPYLPVMAGFAIQSTAVSERFLYDVRTTIAELLEDNFFGTLARLAHDKGCLFSAESVAPIMVGDGTLHYRKVDLPMGEFWLRSPTHDKPNDILDAISAGHIYGKNIIQAESFTELRNEWDEYPGMLKTLQDHNYAMGINRFVYHVFNENPWLDRQPGMTLGGVGLFFQRDQTWWKLAKAWVDYGRRCQYLLQQGHPVVDIAVYTGEEIPRRAVLPDRLVATLPGLFGKETVEKEKQRLANKGNAMQQIPEGVSSSANITTLKDWINPLNGYHYDSFNQDALLNLATVKKGAVKVPKGPDYALFVVPRIEKMDPNNQFMTWQVADKLLKMARAGATILMDRLPKFTPGLYDYKAGNEKLQQRLKALLGIDYEKMNLDDTKDSLWMHAVGKGRVLIGPYKLANLDTLGIFRDVIALNKDASNAKGIAWNHRRVDGVKDIYFVANQLDSMRTIQLSVRVIGKIPELYDAVSDKTWPVKNWQSDGRYTHLNIQLAPNASLFVLLEKPTTKTSENKGDNLLNPKVIKQIEGSWQVRFEQRGGSHIHEQAIQTVTFDSLTDWKLNTLSAIHYYSGTAQYSKSFEWPNSKSSAKTFWLSLGKVADIASVQVNGIDCGTAWTYPYRVDITRALKNGKNLLVIQVANTWANRLIGDSKLPTAKRVTWTTAPFYLQGKPLLSSGLLGPVVIQASVKE